MAALSDFLPYLRLSAPTCPELLLQDLVRRGAIQFCRTSGLVRALATLTTTAGLGEYDLSALTGLPANVTVRSVASVSKLGIDLRKGTRDTYRSAQSLDPAEPTQYVDSDDLHLALMPIPDQAYALVVDAVLEPSRTATVVPDVLRDEWLDGVLNLARGYLFDLPATAWHNPQSAGVYRALGLEDAHKARIQMAVGRVGGDMRMRPRRFE